MVKSGFPLVCLVCFAGAAFRGMFSKMYMLMDQHLNEDVARQLMEDSPLDTKTDLVIEGAEEGVGQVLH